MELDLENLPRDIDLLHQLIRDLIRLLEQTGNRSEKQQRQIDYLLRQLYGRKSEKLDPAQLLLAFADLKEQIGAGDIPAGIASDLEKASQGEDQEGSRKKRRGKAKGEGRKPLPAYLPRERIEYPLPAGKEKCSCCGDALTRIGEEVSEQLEYVPSSLKVLQHIVGTYACPKCEEEIVTTEKPIKPIEKGIPAAGLLAQVLVSKYLDHLPLHRQEMSVLKREGVDLSRSTLCGWVGYCADILEAIYLALKAEILAGVVIQADDTSVRVQLKEDGTSGKARLWVYIGDTAHPFVVFDCRPDWKQEGPQRFLAGFKGFLQGDGYAGFQSLYKSGDVTEVACWMHARRNFFEAREEDPRCLVVIAYVRRLYDIEDQAKKMNMNHEARQELRQVLAQPILDELKGWLDLQATKSLPKEPFGLAVSYVLNRWPELTRYVTNGALEIDNGEPERALRHIAVGRKNWLHFANTEGGRRAAIIYTIIASCKRVGVDPFLYLRDVLVRVSTHPASRIRELLPDQWKDRFQPAAPSSTGAVLNTG